MLISLIHIVIIMVFNPIFTINTYEHNQSKFSLPVKGYPGYIDINTEEAIFYWMFAKDTSNNLPNTLSNKNPLVLYIPGGPGVSLTDTIFYGPGPYKFLSRTKIGKSPVSWTS